MDKAIGIFDSGVGGLTVMREVARLLPYEDLLYLGDTARVPYGNRGAETVQKYALNATRFLVQKDIKALVIACNTATAYGLPALRAAYPHIPVIGVVDPVSRLAESISTSRAIGVLGTRGTVGSKCYDAALLALDPNLNVVSKACPLLVPLAEENWLSGPVVDAVIQEYLEPLASTELDVLILGCTHYPILREAIQTVAGRLWNDTPRILDSAEATATALNERLASAGLLQTRRARTLQFFATDDPRNFASTALTFFGDELGYVEHVDIIDSIETPVS